KSPAPAALVTNSADICTTAQGSWLLASGRAGMPGPGFGPGARSRKPKASLMRPLVSRVGDLGDDRWRGWGKTRGQRFRQRDLQHFVHRRHQMQVERVEHVLGDIRQILLV